MPRMEITTAIGCVNNCSYCPQDVLKEAYSGETIMSMNVFKTCLEKIPRAVNINFSGFCEPFVNPLCADMILYAHGRGHEIIVYTTFHKISRDDLSKIKNVPFKIFAVHDIDPEISMNRELIREFIPMVEFIKAEENFKISSRAGNLGKVERAEGPLMCLRSLRCNVLLPNGDVVVCCNDYGLKHKLGNLLEDEYVDLYLGKEYRRLLNGLRDDSEDIICRYCDNFMSKVKEDGSLEKYPELFTKDGVWVTHATV